jgi:hypothetical protein
MKSFTKGNTNMYELPTITYIGEAKDVVLGIAAIGSDLDGTWVNSSFEFMDDGGAAEFSLSD